MRYILLFLIAILLPVFAFLNFTYRVDDEKSAGNKTGEKQTAALNFSEVSSDASSSTVFASEEGIAVTATSTGENTESSESSDAAIVASAEEAEEPKEETKSKPEGGKIVGDVSEYINKVLNSISGTDPGQVERSSEIRYILPQATYTYPSTFPQTSEIRQPYLERLKNPSFVPLRNWDIDFANIDGKALLVIEPGTQKVLYNKNIFESRPIASLTKLMAAMVVIDEMDLKDEVLISKSAVDSYGEMGGLVVDEKLTVENLLYIMLISSSNDAAISLQEYYDAFRADESATFVAAMNMKAQEYKLFDSLFVEPTGLDENNVSTAYDLARLADRAFSRPLLRQIMSTAVIDIRSVDGNINHRIVNSNKLLGVIPGVLGGKTGYTEEAGESIVLFVKKLADSEPDDYLIYVILGAQDRVKSARQVIDWMASAYVWE